MNEQEKFEYYATIKRGFVDARTAIALTLLNMRRLGDHTRADRVLELYDSLGQIRDEIERINGWDGEKEPN